MARSRKPSLGALAHQLSTHTHKAQSSTHHPQAHAKAAFCFKLFRLLPPIFTWLTQVPEPNLPIVRASSQQLPIRRYGHSPQFSRLVTFLYFSLFHPFIAFGVKTPYLDFPSKPRGDSYLSIGARGQVMHPELMCAGKGLCGG